jgi:hypothetical protein
MYYLYCQYHLNEYRNTINYKQYLISLLINYLSIYEK